MHIAKLWSKNRKLVLLLGLGVAVHVSLSSPLLCQTPAFSVNPGKMELEVNPGTEKTAAFEITAASAPVPERGRIMVSQTDWSILEDGSLTFKQPGSSQEPSASSWITFSPSALTLESAQTQLVRITVTVPENPAGRAIVAVFRSNTKVQGRDGFAMTASLGALMTFTLSKELQIESSPLHFDGLSEGDDLVISEWVTNTGSEPVVSKGVVAILNSTGKLVGKVPVEALRLLPGERLQFKAGYPSTLKSGKYRALMTLEHDGTVLTTSSNFDIQ